LTRNYPKAHPFDVVLNPRGSVPSPYSRDAELQRRFYWLAVRLRKIDVPRSEDKNYLGLRPEDKEYLISVFTALGHGADPAKVFGGKPIRGSRRGGAYLAAKAREEIKGYIATMITPESQGGFSMSLEDAIRQAAELFGYRKSTIEQYWHKSDKKRDFIV
jgi:hypothetical protein